MNTPGGGGGNTGVSDQIAMVVGSPGGGLSGASDDDDDNCPSSPGSVYEEGTDLMAAAMGDEVTAQLAAAGMILFNLANVSCPISTSLGRHFVLVSGLFIAKYMVCEGRDYIMSP